MPLRSLRFVGRRIAAGPAVSLLLLWCVFVSVLAAEGNRPNIVFLLADDLGYGDLGSYGQKKIRTPNLDQLAEEGMRFTQHYSGSPVCAPSRYVLMTGVHPGHAYIRSNRERTPAEGQEPIPSETVTLAKLLKDQGYVTGAFGKWGLGGPGTEGEPLRQGFDRFFGYNCQRHAHTYYPTYLWDDDRRLPVDNPEIPVHEDLPEGLDPNDPASYDRYKGNVYSSDLYTERALDFIRENRDRPFFLYYPTLVPHVALQVPDDSLSEYLGRWDDPPYTGGRNYVPNFTPRATYAAMVTRMDRNVGRILSLLRELGLEENTIIVFTSDNGATESAGGADADFFQSNGLLRDYKGSLYEGGVRVPLIVKWKGRVRPGSVSDRVTGFEDWVPTLLEAVGAEEAIPDGIDGIGFLATLLGGDQPERPFLYREYPARGGGQTVRVGDWKGVRRNLVSGPGSPNLHVELYDLASDVGETRDVSQDHPEVVARIEALMLEQRVPSSLFPIPVLDRKALGGDRIGGVEVRAMGGSKRRKDRYVEAVEAIGELRGLVDGRLGAGVLLERTER